MTTALLEQWEAEAPAGGNGPAAALRRAGAERLRTAGLPTTRDEDWKFTSVQPIATTAWRSAPSAPSTLDSSTLDPFLFGHPSWPRLVFVDGHFAPALPLDQVGEIYDRHLRARTV